MAKEKSIVELRDEHGTLSARIHELTAAIRSAEREPTADEAKELRNANLRCTEISNEVNALQLQAVVQHGEALTRRNEPSKGGVTLRQAICELVNGGTYSEGVQALNKRGRDLLEAANQTPSKNSLCIPVESRSAFTATGAEGTGSDLIETNFLNIADPLRANLVFAKAGATLLTGLRGDIDVPSYSGSTVKWEGENVPAEDGGGTFSHKKLRPKRLTAKLLISKQLLIQDDLGVDALLRNDIIAQTSTKLEATLLGGAAHADTVPDGFFTGVAAPDFTKKDTWVELDWNAIVARSTAVANNNAASGQLGYIMHTMAEGYARTTVLGGASSPRYIIEPTQTGINGFPFFSTSAAARVPMLNPDAGSGYTEAYGLIFGNWADYIIGQWGSIELTVDPYTQADSGLVRLIVNSYWDAAPRRDASFSKVYCSFQNFFPDPTSARSGKAPAPSPAGK
ncbi:MAG: phage major capsid protein [Tannerellaceae bacterium]|jgi:HK97 family phage major capsid protein|nr:phage major capsid protein [Tannerellaceae bacterium]